MILKYKIQGMSCEGCARTVKLRLENVPGVKQVNVSLSENKVSLEVEQSIDINSLQEALKGTTYRIINQLK